MDDDIARLFEERLGRYQAAIALEPLDRIPIAPGSNYFAETYTGNTNQETIYDPEKWLKAEIAFCRDFPEVDTLRDNRVWAPVFDILDLRTYRIPGRDLPPKDQFQFMEKEYMKADEYDLLIKNPVEFLFECWYPRIFGELRERGSIRSYIAFLKAGMAHMMMGQIIRKRVEFLQNEVGMPQPMAGVFLAPFDVLADAMRGMTGIFIDIFKRPEKVVAACDVLVEEMANWALSNADPQRRWPIFVPTHKATFMSPEQFDTFYWPSFKKVMEILIDAGYTIRVYLEGDWGKHWHHMLELPKGKVLCDIDNQGDILRAKKEIGHHQCIAGGIKDSLFILGTPQEMRLHVKHLCETVGQGGGFIIGGGCNIPYATKPENFRAMIDAVMEYGVYDKNLRPKARKNPPGEIKGISHPKMYTPWKVKLGELGAITGDENLIKRPWEMFESIAYSWLWQWVI
ncbi:MAG: hypothetical protein N2745_05725 [Syntrophorhabdaceae bacterium]|nr:hypothetical protein [Syntrophorhabdaceae bacterium]